MIKKTIILSVLVFLSVSALFAQSLYDNEYYKKSVEFTRLSEQAMDAGEYDLSAEHAIKAQEYAALSKQYIAEMVMAYRARTALVAAKERIELADRLNIKGRDNVLYEEASAFFAAANEKFNSKDYENSITDSQKVIELLKDIATAPVEDVLAAFYEVKLNVEKRDCLWRIAGFDYIYGDPLKWQLLYDANRETFPDPGNPDLIVPGQILKIPSIEGEKRSGTR